MPHAARSVRISPGQARRVEAIVGDTVRSLLTVADHP
jgi:hypothetical protein